MHDETTCDAFPLAVGLAQVQARYERLEALADNLAEALGQATAGWDREARDMFGANEALAAYTLHKING